MKKNKKLYLFIFFISFICILICSKNSPLYPFNDWVDENAFMTVGRSWRHGIIPYKEIFEQKGPFLYLIFMISSLFSKTSFIGAFIFEIIFIFFTLVFTKKLVNLFISEKYNYYILPIFVAIITASRFFACGGSAEEFSFPFIMYSLYVFFKIIKEKEFDIKELFFSGVCAGAVSMIKFNLLGFWIGFGFCLFLYHLIKKEYVKGIKRISIFLVGMSLPIILFTSYFVINHAFTDFIKTYFLFNANNYSHKIDIIERIKTAFTLFYSQLTLSFIINILTFIGILCFIFSEKYLHDTLSKTFLLVTYIFSFFGIFYGGFTFGYYFLPMTLFIILGLVVCFDYIDNKLKDNKKNTIIITIITIIISSWLLINCHNLPFMKIRKNDLVQFKYAKIINKKKNPTLLNYGSLDAGFYTASNIVPNTKYFELQNSLVPGMYESLDKMITNKEFDFIVVRTYEGFDPRYNSIYDNYKLIKKATQNTGGVDFTYYLYKKN